MIFLKIFPCNQFQIYNLGEQNRKLGIQTKFYVLNSINFSKLSIMSQTQKQRLHLQDIKNGPLSENQRQCRDVICCLLFFANILALAYCTFVAFYSGNPHNVFRATDKFGNICGQTGSVTENYPYSYLYSPTQYISNRVCVKECPYFVSGTLTTLDCYNMTCTYQVIVNSDGSFNVTPSSVSEVVGYESSTTLSRVCLPSTIVLSNALSSVSTSISSTLSQGVFGSTVTDIENNYLYLLIGVGMAVLMSFVIIFLLRFFVGLIVWVSILGTIVVLSGIGVIFLYNGGALKAYSSYVGSMGIPTLQSSDYYNYYGYAVFGVVGVLLILLLCCCGRIRLAVAICKAAGGFITSVPQSLLVPVVMSAFIVAFWGYALVVIVYLMGSATYTYTSGDVFSSISNYTEEKLIYLYYFIFGSLWTNALLGAITIFVIASACCKWYYFHGPGAELDSPIMKSYYMAFRYHFGSLAFGSLILAIVQFMQIIVEVVKKQAETSGADNNVMFQYIINCLRCCLACVQRIVQFINKTAYIQIALRGKNFCMAAKDGFEVVWSNPLRYAVVGGIGEVIMFLGKLMIASSTVAAFYAFITFYSTAASSIQEPIVMLIIVGLVAFAVSMVFMSIYSLAMDSLLACFIVDETNQKANGKNYAMYAPEELQKLMDD